MNRSTLCTICLYILIALIAVFVIVFILPFEIGGLASYRVLSCLGLQKRERLVIEINGELLKMMCVCMKFYLCIKCLNQFHYWRSILLYDWELFLKSIESDLCVCIKSQRERDSGDKRVEYIKKWTFDLINCDLKLLLFIGSKITLLFCFQIRTFFVYLRLLIDQLDHHHHT